MWYAGKSPTQWRSTCSDKRGKSHLFPIQLIWTCARCHKGIVKLWCVHNPCGNTCTSVTVGSTAHTGMLHWMQVKVQTEKKTVLELESTKLGTMRKLCVCVCVSAWAGHALTRGVVRTSFIWQAFYHSHWSMKIGLDPGNYSLSIEQP